MKLPGDDLVVLSHLRWDWVWQRPQHLVSRIGAGRRTLFVEEPRMAEVAEPTVRERDLGPVRRLWVDAPVADTLVDFASLHGLYVKAIDDLLETAHPEVWLYAPGALRVAEALEPRLLVYDVMDDLASFAQAPPETAIRMRRALLMADVAFAGGRSLHRSAASVRGDAATHLFPSGVECAHYAASRAVRGAHARPVAGYVGVLDERLDLELISTLADSLSDWDILMVGPIAKIDPADLPARANIRYLGQQDYDRLPAVMAGLDVALMPFALNEATRSISPTKTLEYLAAGLPVVATRVPDVVADWSAVVHLADDGAGFASACRHVLTHSRTERDRQFAHLQRRHEWDEIAARMRAVLDRHLADSRAAA